MNSERRIPPQVKTKAYKLAAELGMTEDSVMDWLRQHGYPRVRRSDTIRADIAQQARRALGEGTQERRGSGRHSQTHSARDTRSTGAQRERPRASQSRPAPRESRPRQSQTQRQRDTRPRRQQPQREEFSTGEFKLSFAEMLEAHLPDQVDGGAANPETSVTVPGMPAISPQPSVGPKFVPPPSSDEELRLRVARAESDRDFARREAEAAVATGNDLQRQLDGAQIELASLRARAGDIESLTQEVERLRLERATLRQRVAAAADEQSTLEATCGELQTELADVRSHLAELENDQSEHGSLVDELQSAVQREGAWRARALALERTASAGDSLGATLAALGIEELRDQARTLQALLGHREGARGFFRAVRKVDNAGLQRIVERQVQRTCANAVCNQVTAEDEKVALRVDSAKDCAVCGGDENQRWFARMVRECGRSGVRRLLLVGGEDAHADLRGMSQGTAVDFRLVASAEEAPEARVKGRVEGCDLLVLWSSWLVNEALTRSYAVVAEASARPVVHILGRRLAVAPLARAVCNRLARNHVLLAQ